VFATDEQYCTSRRDTYVPFLMKMLADPSGPPSPSESIWPDFAKRFFAA
jgi:hypothetical protein